jgi:RNA polymerase sigma-70 factor, ECF subfamily
MRFVRIQEDAEDIVQQSFQKAFVYLERFEGKSRFSTWLTRIAINEALMWLRRKRASPEVPIEDSTTIDETAVAVDLADSDPSPEDNCLHEEQKRILSAAVKQSTVSRRKVMSMGLRPPRKFSSVFLRLAPVISFCLPFASTA